MPVNSDTLRTIAFSNLNRIPAARGDDIRSYVHTVLVWLSEWAVKSQQRSNIEPGYCALVLSPDTVQDGTPKASREARFFKEDKSPMLGGNVYVTDYALNTVYRYAPKCRDLSDIANQLTKRGLAKCPFVAFDVETYTGYIFAAGLETRPTLVPLREDLPHPFDLAAFKSVLDDIYRDNLKYAEAYPGLWHDTDTRVPCKQTELIVQNHICAILKARSQGSGLSTGKWLTISEKKNNGGRIDIAIYRSEDCIVATEIKVLRVRRHNPDPAKALKVSTAFNEKWAKRGARQAQRYKEAEPAQAGVLVLYDMRDKDRDIRAAVGECKKRGITHLRYYLHNGIPDGD